jgi:hypothetical protein
MLFCAEVPNGNLFRIKKWQNISEIIRIRVNGMRV